MALIGEDIAVTIEIGTQAAGGGAVTWGAAVNIKGIARTLEIEESAEMIGTKALANTRKKFRSGSGEGNLTIDHLVDITGWYYFSSGTLNGRPARVSVKENSSLATPRQWVGIIERWKWTAGTDQEQAENISIKCDIDATSY